MKGADQKSRERLDSLTKQQAVTPKEAHLIDLERQGYGQMRRKFKKDGSYSYAFNFKPNDGQGKISRAAEAVGELMVPGWKVARDRSESNKPDAPTPFRGTLGVYADRLTAKELETFCQRCECRKWACECP